MAMEPGAVEIREEHARDTDFARSGLVEFWKIFGGHQVVSMVLKTDCGCGLHVCLIEDGMRNNSK